LSEDPGTFTSLQAIEYLKRINVYSESSPELASNRSQLIWLQGLMRTFTIHMNQSITLNQQTAKSVN